MGRYDLTDFEWRIIKPLLPNKPRGVPRVDDRRVYRASSSRRAALLALYFFTAAGAASSSCSC